MATVAIHALAAELRVPKCHQSLQQVPPSGQARGGPFPGVSCVPEAVLSAAMPPGLCSCRSATSSPFRLLLHLENSASFQFRSEVSLLCAASPAFSPSRRVSFRRTTGSPGRGRSPRPSDLPFLLSLRTRRGLQGQRMCPIPPCAGLGRE